MLYLFVLYGIKVVIAKFRERKIKHSWSVSELLEYGPLCLMAQHLWNLRKRNDRYFCYAEYQDTVGGRLDWLQFGS